MTKFVRKLLVFGLLELEDEVFSSLLLLQLHFMGAEHALHEVRGHCLLPAYAHLWL